MGSDFLSRLLAVSSLATDMHVSDSWILLSLAGVRAFTLRTNSQTHWCVQNEAFDVESFEKCVSMNTARPYSCSITEVKPLTLLLRPHFGSYVSHFVVLPTYFNMIKVSIVFVCFHLCLFV